MKKIRCARCRKPQLPKCFNLDRSRPSGRYPRCKTCVNKTSRKCKRRKRAAAKHSCACGHVILSAAPECQRCTVRRTRAAVQRKQHDAAALRVRSGIKKCRKCKQPATLNTFRKSRASLDGRGSTCHGCTKFDEYRSRARRKRIAWDLTLTDVVALISAACTYCGDPNADGIDRIEPQIGYLKHNLVPCCKTCNTMKLNYPHAFWLEHMRKVLAHHAN